MQMIFEGASAVISGGASGLGEATARMLRALGTEVAIFDLDPAKGEALAEEISASFFRTDVTDQANVIAALDSAAEKNGTARIVVNCAGIGSSIKTVSRGEAFPLAEFRKTIDVNLTGTFNVLAQAAARMAKLDPIGEERGVIINTASAAAFDGQMGQAAYSASKAAIAGMTLPIARDLSSLAIRVMTIAPGLFMTPLLMGLPEDVRQSLGRQVPFPSRLGDPGEYAMLVKSIVENPMLNGETIRLDGAIRMAPR